MRSQVSGSYGTDRHAFNSPIACAFSSSLAETPAVYISDQLNNRIKKYTANADGTLAEVSNFDPECSTTFMLRL
jgi:hypothetical protein